MAKQAGRDDFIPKPIHREYLITKVKKYVSAG